MAKLVDRGTALTLLALLAASITTGCGEAYPDEARKYTAAAQKALIARGVCADTDSCTRGGFVFWEGGNPWVPSLKKVFINLYGVKDRAVLEAVAMSITRSKESIGGPPCQLTAYSSGHGKPKMKVGEVAIN